MKIVSRYSFLLFALYPVIHLYSINRKELSNATVMLVPFLMIAFVSILSFEIINFYIKKENSTSIIVSAIITYVFSYKSIIDIVKKKGIFLFGITGNKLGILIYILIGIIVIFGVAITKKWHSQIKKVVIIVGVIMVLMPTLTISDLKKDNMQNKIADKEKNIKLDINKPDIYYIILDAHTSMEVLKKEYGYNYSFDKFLKENGFKIIENGKSNFRYTVFSIASILNMDYLIEEKRKIKNKNDTSPFINRIKDNSVMKMLKLLQYRNIYITSAFDFEMNDVDEKYITFNENGINTDFTNILFGLTILEAILVDSGTKKINKSIDILSRYFNEGLEHKFVFVHILCPHPPFIFDRNGKERGIFKRIITKNNGNIYDKRGYLEQAIFIEKRIEEVILKIKKNHKKRDFIIVVQGDHGSFQQEQNYDILNAIYFSNKYYDGISKAHTPVNTFRVILNKYFNTKYEILPNKQYLNKYEDAGNFNEYDWRKK